jgi:hypothetical protein
MRLNFERMEVAMQKAIGARRLKAMVIERNIIRSPSKK